MEKLINQIKECKRMTELDSLRMECVAMGKEHGSEGFKNIQSAFVKQKNKIKRSASEAAW